MFNVAFYLGHILDMRLIFIPKKHARLHMLLVSFFLR